MKTYRNGFTLLELLVASALAVILTGGVLSITAGLARDLQRMEQRSRRPLHPGVADLIRRDLVHAAKLVQDEQGRTLTIIGNGELDARRLRAGGGLVRVTYRIEPRGTAALLVREQVALDDPLNRGAWREVVASGIDGLKIHGAAEGVEADAPSSGIVQIRLTGGGVVDLPWRR